jgi:Domain of unknown function (DUF4191)
MAKFPGRRPKAQEPTKTAKDPNDPASMGRIKQIRMVAGFIRKNDPRALPIVIGSGVGVLVIFVVVGLLTSPGLFIPLGVLLGLLTSTLIFGRYGQKAQFAAIEGQPGAAAAIVQSMRGGNWTVTPAIAGNRNMDIVHRAVGRPGVVLIGEGSKNGLATLMSAEKKRIARIKYAVPIKEIQVGDEPGQIPIRQLQRTLMRMPRELKAGEVTELNERLKALPASLQAPRGPMPRAGRMPRQPRPRVR